MGTANTVGVVLEELGEIAQTVAAVLGHSPAGVVAQVAGLVFYDAANVAHVVDADQIEAIRQSRQTGMAAGAAAYAESHQDFARRCSACDATLAVCDLMQETSAVACCVNCSHPTP